MFRLLQISICLLLVLLPVWGPRMHAAEILPPQRVLVIYGNAVYGLWERSFNEVFLDKVSSNPAVRVMMEYIEVSLSGEDALTLLAESIDLKLSSITIDLVVAIQPAASGFLHRWGDIFAADIPKLYIIPGAEVREAVSASGSGVSLESGVKPAVANTIQLMPILFPRLENVFVVSGDSASDRSYLSRIQEIMPRSQQHLQINYLTGMTPVELVDVLQAVPENSAVLLGVYDRDHTGGMHRTSEISAILSEQLSIPVFGFIDSVLGAGSIGGNITNSKFYAERAAELSLAMLAGETPLDGSTPPTAFVFDGEQLDRFDVDRSQLPEGSEILNDSSPLWLRYLAEIVLGLAIIAIQLLLILALFHALRKRQKAEKERDKQIVGRENQVRLFESVINGITDAIVITDLDEKIVAGNDAGFYGTFACQVSDMIGQPVINLVEALDSKTEQDSIFSDLTMQPSVRNFQQAEGKIFPGEFVSSRITDVDGKTTGFFALIRDVTLRLSQEEELRQAHKMEALGNLAGGIAHDFNNILMAIVGSAEIAKISLDDPDRLDDQLSNIVVASDRAKRLVSQILLFSRHSEEVLRPVDLQNLLEESAALIRASSPKSIDIAVSTTDKLWNVNANATQVQQVLMNLCANAQYAMENSGQIFITATNQEITESKKLFKDSVPPGKYVSLSISDTGTGISPKDIAFVFDPFFTTKPRGEGTGMGLALVYGIVKSHGAYLDLQSEVGQGTTVTLYLKATRGNESETRQALTGKISQGNGELILLIDDEEMVVEVNRRMLMHLGYSVESYTDAVEGMRTFEASPDKFDLVISDLSMPNLDGVTLLENVRQLRRDIPTILCTGYLDAIPPAEAENSSDFTVLIKPSSMATISTAVVDALSFSNRELASQST